MFDFNFICATANWTTAADSGIGLINSHPMQSGKQDSQVFYCKEANCGRMFEDLEQYQRHLKKRHNKSSDSDEYSTVAQSLATELQELKQLEASVESLAHNLKAQAENDDEIYARSILEIELNKSKQNKRLAVTYEAVQEAREMLTAEFVIQKAKESPENQEVNSLELFEVLRIKNCGLCFFDKSDYFNPDSLSELKLLDLSSNALLTIGGINYLYRLETLDISSNCISSLESLQECTTLRHLNCSDNFIESCKELQSMKKLRTLNLASNKLKNLGELLVVIQEMPKLRELLAKDNTVRLGNQGSQALELQT